MFFEILRHLALNTTTHCARISFTICPIVHTYSLLFIYLKKKKHFISVSYIRAHATRLKPALSHPNLWHMYMCMGWRRVFGESAAVTQSHSRQCRHGICHSPRCSRHPGHFTHPNFRNIICLFRCCWRISCSAALTSHSAARTTITNCAGMHTHAYMHVCFATPGSYSIYSKCMFDVVVDPATNLP